MEIIIVCISAIIIVGIICYTRYKLEGVDYYKRAFERIDSVIYRISDLDTKLDEVRDYILQILTYCQLNK